MQDTSFELASEAGLVPISFLWPVQLTQAILKPWLPTYWWALKNEGAAGVICLSNIGHQLAMIIWVRQDSNLNNAPDGGVWQKTTCRAHGLASSVGGSIRPIEYKAFRQALHGGEVLYLAGAIPEEVYVFCVSSHVLFGG